MFESKCPKVLVLAALRFSVPGRRGSSRFVAGEECDEGAFVRKPDVAHPGLQQVAVMGRRLTPALHHLLRHRKAVGHVLDADIAACPREALRETVMARPVLLGHGAAVLGGQARQGANHLQRRQAVAFAVVVERGQHARRVVVGWGVRGHTSTGRPRHEQRNENGGSEAFHPLDFDRMALNLSANFSFKRAAGRLDPGMAAADYSGG